MGHRRGARHDPPVPIKVATTPKAPVTAAAAKATANNSSSRAHARPPQKAPGRKSKLTPPPDGPAFLLSAPISFTCLSDPNAASGPVLRFQCARVAEHETNVGAACLETLARIIKGAYELLSKAFFSSLSVSTGPHLPSQIAKSSPFANELNAEQYAKQPDRSHREAGPKIESNQYRNDAAY